MKPVYVCQLPAKQKLEVYKRVKNALIQNDALTYENIRNALDSKIADLF